MSERMRPDWISSGSDYTTTCCCSWNTWQFFQENILSLLQISGKNCQALSQLLILQKVLVNLQNIHKMTVGGRVGALWIGGLEPYMDETFLQVTFIAFTFTASVTTG